MKGYEKLRAKDDQENTENMQEEERQPLNQSGRNSLDFLGFEPPTYNFSEKEKYPNKITSMISSPEGSNSLGGQSEASSSIVSPVNNNNKSSKSKNSSGDGLKENQELMLSPVTVFDNVVITDDGDACGDQSIPNVTIDRKSDSRASISAGEKQKSVKEQSGITSTLKFHWTASDEERLQLALLKSIPHVDMQLTGGPESHESNAPIARKMDNIIVDGQIEEIFTFETFISLVVAAFIKEKDFILAKVMTREASGKEFYSYYQGHQINKVLFRTQPEEGLLHRMKARNPLNNMIVEGDVHYYVISPSEVRRVLAEQQRKSVNRKALQQQQQLHHHHHHHQNSSNSNNNSNLRDKTDGGKGLLGTLLSSPWTNSSLCDVSSTSRQNDSNRQNAKDSHSGTLYHLIDNTWRLSADDLLCYTVNDEIQGSSNLNTEKAMIAAKDQTHARSFSSSSGSVAFTSQKPSLDNFNISHSLSLSRKDSGFVRSGELLRHRSFSGESDLDESGHHNMETDDQDIDRVTLKAQYYATDDDFLMKASVREYFKLNSVESDDYILFTLYPQDSGRGLNGFGAAGGDVEIIFEPTPWDSDAPASLANCFGLVRRRYLRLYLLGYLVTSCLLVKFAVPTDYAYLTGFLLVFFFAMFVVFIIEFDSIRRTQLPPGLTPTTNGSPVTLPAVNTNIHGLPPTTADNLV